LNTGAVTGYSIAMLLNLLHANLCNDSAFKIGSTPLLCLGSSIFGGPDVNNPMCSSCVMLVWKTAPIAGFPQADYTLLGLTRL